MYVFRTFKKTVQEQPKIVMKSTNIEIGIWYAAFCCDNLLLYPLRENSEYSIIESTGKSDVKQKR